MTKTNFYADGERRHWDDVAIERFNELIDSQEQLLKGSITSGHVWNSASCTRTDSSLERPGHFSDYKQLADKWRKSEQVDSAAQPASRGQLN